MKPEIETDPETGEVISQKAMLMVANSCNSFWRTMPLLAEDPKNPDDINTDQEDHIYDCLRYMCMARPISTKPAKKRYPPGSFMADRAKYIRAKKYAGRRGISMAQAYTKVR